MSPVSAHAILRWLERVERVDVESIRAECTPGITDGHLIALLRLRGVDIERVRETILTPAARKGLEMGARAIRRSGFKLLIEGGTIVTVIREPKRVMRRAS